uniref:Putative ATP-dependent endonuclease of the OLD family n=1 Tax=Candidatus Kentrum sp. UNK TaxID=2126344 RepID=A0A451AU50_9GAMM|nr:MAG: putative ATP-dependent endonuclease of the OLD family [Candidatus Kentron sp. UNK]VFK69581.1 MAG: putative ATP-dependent endonuclease of the OLD family [Candidatus Kentron sp. UNK]
MNIKGEHSGIKLIEARIRNFRSLRKVDIPFDDLTVLIGENNSGKTSLLEALFAAIGAGRRVIEPEDLFLDIGESKPPKDREIIIDLLFRPANESGFLEQFDSYWLNLWGSGVSQDKNKNGDERDFLAIRTWMRWNPGKGEYVTERRFLQNWPDSDNSEHAKINSGYVTSAQLEPIALYLMDAKRDIRDELHNRGSFWHKLIADPGLPDDKVKEIEQTLDGLNETIIQGSEVLSHVQEHLNDLYKTVSTEKGDVSIMPLARHLRDLGRGMDISFRTKDAQTFPLARHGMGTRSLAAVLTFRAYSRWRQMNAKDDAVHSLLALEEPEAHLHPQAQRALFGQIAAIPGQRIISTHSPYIASQANVANFRHFRKEGTETKVSRIDTSSLDPEDLRKIERMVLNTRGEILFARALVLFEGETEEQALPVFARAYWGEHIHALGISMVGVSGKAYLPFARLAESFAIPWFIFSDGEDKAISPLGNVLKRLGKPEGPYHHPNIFIIPEGKDFEGYLVTADYEDILIDVVVGEKTKNEQHKKALKTKWDSVPDKPAAIRQELSDNKTRYARPIAEAITELDDEKLRFPPLIRQLFDTMSKQLGLTKQEASIP